MSLRLYDFECTCGRIFEELAPSNVYDMACTCGKTAKRIISASGVYMGNQDGAWLKTVLEVVDKDSRAPHVVEFRKNPTRENYKRWMKGEGLRPADSNVRGAPPTLERRSIDTSHIRREVWDKHRQRRRIET